MYRLEKVSSKMDKNTFNLWKETDRLMEMKSLKKMFSPIGRNIVVSGEPFYGEMLMTINHVYYS